MGKRMTSPGAVLMTVPGTTSATSESAMQQSPATRNSKSRRRNRRQLMSLLLLGSEDAFRDDVSTKLLSGRDFTVLARTSSLLQGIACLESKAVDVVLVSPEFNDEELSLFTFDARRCGFAGLILRAADRPEESSNPAIGTDRPIQVGDFFLEADSRRVWVRGKEMPCWAQEFDLLHFLCKHPEQLLSYEVLLQAVWREPSASRQMLRELIRDLRAKIETTSTPHYIVEHRLFGYRFVPSPHPEL
jgi:hypothetical protein